MASAKTASATTYGAWGSFDLRVEDIAIMPQLEAAMQDAILSAVENEIDEEGFNGDGTGGNLNGLGSSRS